MAIRNIPVELKNGTVMTPADPGSTEPQTGKGLVVMYSTVTVRSSPSQYGPVVGYVKKDDIVDIEDVVYGKPDVFTEYYKIRYDTHQTGYVNARFVRRF